VDEAERTSVHAAVGPGSGHESEPEPELFCPHCDYSLTGLQLERCPECGRGFDRQELVRWATWPSMPVPFGDPVDTTSLPFASLFAPARLGRRLPPWPDVRAIRVYRYGTRAFAIVAMALPFRALGADFVAAVLAMLVASHGCEFLVAQMLKRLVEPRSVPRDQRTAFWRALTRCFSTHLVITVGVCSVMVRLLNRGHVREVTGLLTMLALLALVFLWWWYCLGQAVTARGLPSPGRTAVVYLIPFIGAGSLIVSVLTFVVLMRLVW
jgi:hypothetical protein